MKLLEADERYLKEKGFEYELVPEGENGCLIIKRLKLAPEKFNRDVTDLLICIPKAYNDATLDNFYVEPELRMKATGQYPQSADVMEDHAGKKWQRFSRHMPVWRAGIDSLKSFMPAVYRELQNRN